jgi:hypothetical protein
MNQYVHPANHVGGPKSTDPNAPLYGTRLRLKSTFDVNKCLTSGDYNDPQWLVAIVKALKQYGAILTDGDGIPAFSLCFERSFAYPGPDGKNPWEYLGIEQRALTQWCGITAADFQVVAPPDYNVTTRKFPVINYRGDCTPIPFPTDTCAFVYSADENGEWPEDDDDDEDNYNKDDDDNDDDNDDDHHKDDDSDDDSDDHHKDDDNDDHHKDDDNDDDSDDDSDDHHKDDDNDDHHKDDDDDDDRHHRNCSKSDGSSSTDINGGQGSQEDAGLNNHQKPNHNNQAPLGWVVVGALAGMTLIAVIAFVAGRKSVRQVPYQMDSL